jgi:hypothetical protein
VRLKAPRLKGMAFETAIIERYRRCESSAEEAIVEMYLYDATINGGTLSTAGDIMIGTFGGVEDA